MQPTPKSGAADATTSSSSSLIKAEDIHQLPLNRNQTQYSIEGIMVSAFMRSCIGLIDRWLRYSSVLSLGRGSFFPVVSCLRRKTDNFPLTWCRTLSPPSQLSLSSGVAGSGLTSVPPPSSSSPNDEDCLSSEERALPRRRIILLCCTTRPLPRGLEAERRAKRRVRPDNGRLS